MHKLKLKKPDGRNLILYSRNPIDVNGEQPIPRGLPPNPNPHLRWHKLRGEWVAYANYRQGRTFLPPAEFNPLAPTKDAENPTELPQGNYDAAVFENSFPSLTRFAHDAPDTITRNQPGFGICEVLVYTQDVSASLGTLPLSHIELIISVWADRYRVLADCDFVQYIMPFENRGVEVGVTLHHPHGQIYAYPFIPAFPARELQQQRIYYEQNGRGLLEDHIQDELRDEIRILYRGDHFIAFMPVFARYTYEVWIAPIRPAASVADLTAEETNDFARALKTVLLKYDGLWQRPFPYVMVFHQAPTNGARHPEAHFHVEFYPPYRTKDRLKYLAGTEIGAGMFANDSIPEEKAAELRAIQVKVD